MRAWLTWFAPSPIALRRSGFSRAWRSRSSAGGSRWSGSCVSNEKFSPEWRPRYLIYESRLGLPRAILRVLEVEGYVGERGGSRSLDGHRPAPLALPHAERSGLGELP